MHAKRVLSKQHSQIQRLEQIDCVRLSHRDGWSVAIVEPGRYCVAQNLYQSWPAIHIPHQPVPRDPLITINSSNVTVDLAERKLVNRTPIGKGVWVSSSSRSPFRKIRISNGSIITSTRPSVIMINDWNSDNRRFGRGYFIASSHGDLTQYRPTEYVLENLTLEAENHVIIMQGMKNVIRNCRIIGGNGTVNLYGPNLLFEKNEIILRVKNRGALGAEPPVALYLEDAANSIVRNNRIVISGRSAQAEAIVLKNSPNVLLEGNTIKGAKHVYQLLDERSTVMDLENTVR